MIVRGTGVVLENLLTSRISSGSSCDLILTPRIPLRWKVFLKYPATQTKMFLLDFVQVLMSSIFPDCLCLGGLSFHVFCTNLRLKSFCYWNFFSTSKTLHSTDNKTTTWRVIQMWHYSPLSKQLNVCLAYVSRQSRTCLSALWNDAASEALTSAAVINKK